MLFLLLVLMCLAFNVSLGNTLLLMLGLLVFLLVFGD